MVKSIAVCFIASSLTSLFAAASASTTTLTASPASALLGQTVTITASVTPSAATGTVTFYDGSTVLGTSLLSGGAASFATNLIPSGKRTLTAVYRGDPSTAASASVSFTETVRSVMGTGFSPVNYPASTFATEAAIADFNGDGKPDIAMVGTLGQEVIILLGSGNGAFVPGPVHAGGPQSTAIGVGDFNGDGKNDIALLCGSELCILLGNGDGTFTSVTPVRVVAPTVGFSASPQTLTVADFNRDGKADIAIAYEFATVSSPGVGVLLGNGDGTFQTFTGYAAGNFSDSIGAADFNGDGIPDLFVGDASGTVAILLGKGDGTFLPAVTYKVGIGALDCVAGDFNEDGKTDLAVAMNGTPIGFHIAILLGNGDGTFRTGTYVNMPGAYGVLSLAVEDFNGDGHADLALGSTINILNPGTMNILGGKGDGTFSLLSSAPTGYTPHRTLAADLNGDGRADVITSNDSSNDITVLIATSSSVLNIGTTSLTAGMYGVPYSYALAAAGGTAPYSNWRVTSGALPPGLALSSTGVLNGTPTEYKGSPYTFTVTVQDNTGATSPAQSLSLSVAAPIPAISLNGIRNVWSGGYEFQPGSWISIYGTNLSAVTASWNGDYPTSLGGVTVTIDGKRGYLSYVSPTQINLEAPDDSHSPFSGPVPVVLTNDFGSASGTALLSSVAFSLSTLNGSGFAAATIPTPNGSGAYGGGAYDIMGPAGAFSFPTRPVQPGEVLVLYGTGCGTTVSPVPAGIPFSGAVPNVQPADVAIGGVNATVLFSGVVSPGLCQFNVVVPGVKSGNQPLSIGTYSTNGGASETGPLIAVGTISSAPEERLPH